MTDVMAVDLVLLALVCVVGIWVVRVRSLFAATMLGGLYSLLMAVVWSNNHALDVGFTEAAVGAGASTVLLLGCIAATGRVSKDDQKVNVPALLIVLLTGGLLIYGTFDMPHFGDPNAPIHNLRVPKLLAQDVGKHPDREKYLAGELEFHEKAAEGEAGEHHDHGEGAHADERLHADDAPAVAHGDEGTHAEAGHESGHDAGHEGGEHHDAGHAEHAEGDHGGGHAHPADDFNGHVPNTVTSLLAAYRGYDTMFETAVIFTAGVALLLLLRRREDEVAEEWRGRAAEKHTESPQPAHTHAPEPGEEAEA